MNVSLDAVAVVSNLWRVVVCFRWFEPVHAEAVLLHLLTSLSRSDSISCSSSSVFVVFVFLSVNQTRKLTHTHTHSLDDVTDGRTTANTGRADERHGLFRSMYLLVKLFSGRFLTGRHTINTTWTETLNWRVHDTEHGTRVFIIYVYSGRGLLETKGSPAGLTA